MKNKIPYESAKKTPYETDFYRWCFSQANALSNRSYEELDMENLIEELESMGRCQRQMFTSFLKNVFLHLLKYMYQPGCRTPSWQISIDIHREHAETVLYDNPSLKSSIPQCIKRAYSLSIKEAAKETGLDIKTFPKEMPFTYENAMKEGWRP